MAYSPSRVGSFSPDLGDRAADIRCAPRACMWLLERSTRRSVLLALNAFAIAIHSLSPSPLKLRFTSTRFSQTSNFRIISSPRGSFCICQPVKSSAFFQSAMVCTFSAICRFAGTQYAFFFENILPIAHTTNSRARGPSGPRAPFLSRNSRRNGSSSRPTGGSNAGGKVQRTTSDGAGIVLMCFAFLFFS